MRYSVGTIKAVEPASSIVKQNALPASQYNAYIELQNQNAIKLLDNGKLPRFVSPTVFKLNDGEPDDDITDYEPLHIAFVDIPAYGQVATIRGHCNGDMNLCYNQLKNNGIIMSMDKCNNNKKELLRNFSVGEERITAVGGLDPEITDELDVRIKQGGGTGQVT
jgi:hypothetical protein